MNLTQQMMTFVLAIAMVFSGTHAFSYQDPSIPGPARDALFKRLDQKLAELRVQEQQLSILATSLREAQRVKDAWQVVLDINFLGLKRGAVGVTTAILVKRLLPKIWAAPRLPLAASILFGTGLFAILVSAGMIIGRTIHVSMTDAQMQQMRESFPYVQAEVNSLRGTVITLGQSTGASLAGGVLTLKDVPSIRGYEYSELEPNARIQNIAVSPQLFSH